MAFPDDQRRRSGSAYVIDGLIHNDVVKSDIHFTDTYGYTEAVFRLTHLLGFSFAPRIKGIDKQASYIFKPKNQTAKDWAICPNKNIKETVIRENWDDLLRLVASKKTTPLTFSGSMAFIRPSRLSGRSSNPCLFCATLTVWPCVKQSKNRSTRLNCQPVYPRRRCWNHLYLTR